VFTGITEFDNFVTFLFHYQQFLSIIIIITRHRASTSTRWHFAFVLCHSNETHAPIANPSSSVTKGHPYHSFKLHPGPCSSVGMRRLTDTHRDGQTHRHAWPIYISRRLRLTRNTDSIYSIYSWLVNCIHVVMRVSLIVTLDARGRSGEREKRKDQLLTLQRSKQKRTDAEMTSTWKVCRNCLRFIFFAFDYLFQLFASYELKCRIVNTGCHSSSIVLKSPWIYQWHYNTLLVSDIAIFVLKRDVELQLTNNTLHYIKAFIVRNHTEPTDCA